MAVNLYPVCVIQVNVLHGWTVVIVFVPCIFCCPHSRHLSLDFCKQLSSHKLKQCLICLSERFVFYFRSLENI